MWKKIDSTFGWLLVLASCGHTLRTLKLVPFLSGLFVWCLAGSLAVALLGTLNIVRAGRPDDKALAAITAAGTAAWALLALAFGKSIGNMMDPRVLGNLLIAVVLVFFSGATFRMARRHPKY
ncbi:MAG TPA: hypothetical protein VGL97_19455 [Bryobacteraceae bacterium]|jgi:hypothetical protein